MASCFKWYMAKSGSFSVGGRIHAFYRTWMTEEKKEERKSHSTAWYLPLFQTLLAAMNTSQPLDFEQARRHLNALIIVFSLIWIRTRFLLRRKLINRCIPFEKLNSSPFICSHVSILLTSGILNRDALKYHVTST